SLFPYTTLFRSDLEPPQGLLGGEPAGSGQHLRDARRRLLSRPRARRARPARRAAQDPSRAGSRGGGGHQRRRRGDPQARSRGNGRCPNRGRRQAGHCRPAHGDSDPVIWCRSGLVPTPLVESAALHVLTLAGIAWLGSMTGVPLAPPKLVTVEIVPAPPPTAPPPKAVARAIAAVKHALVLKRAPKVVPTPAPPMPPPPAPAPEPTPLPEANPEPISPSTRTETPTTPPAAGTAAVKGVDRALD